MSKYYSEDEMRCKCCEELPEGGIDPNLYTLLDAIVDRVGVKPTINCAYRCPSHNEEVGGVPNSEHVRGCAADLDASDLGVEFLAQVAEACGADGVGRYPSSSFVHVDVRSGRVGDDYRWSEDDV